MADFFTTIKPLKLWTVRALAIFAVAYLGSVIMGLVLLPDCPFIGDYIPACAPLKYIGGFFALAAFIACLIMTLTMLANAKASARHPHGGKP